MSQPLGVWVAQVVRVVAAGTIRQPRCPTALAGSTVHPIEEAVGSASDGSAVAAALEGFWDGWEG